jgi:uncharacterized protein with NRDE domain
MCLILVAFRVVPDLDLIVGANRDEDLGRPTDPAGFWRDKPGILAGRDLVAGGTWLGLNQSGRFAAVANVHDGLPSDPKAPSRGHLITRFLDADYSDTASGDPARMRSNELSEFNGFTMVAWDGRSLVLVTNRGSSRVLAPGIHAVGNHAFGYESPKIVRAKRLFSAALGDFDGRVEKIMEILADPTDATPADVAGADPPGKWPEGPSAIFFRSGSYGTRSSSVVTVAEGFRATLHETSFGEDPKVITRRSYEINLS